MSAEALTHRQNQHLISLDADWRNATDIARRVGLKGFSSPRETASKYCDQLVKLGLAEKGGERRLPVWRRAP